MSMTPLLTLILSSLLPRPVRAQSDAPIAVRATSAVSLTPNGTVDVGTQNMDLRGPTVLTMTPQVLFFGRIGDAVGRIRPHFRRAAPPRTS